MHKVLIVDDQSITRKYLSFLITESSDYVLVGTASCSSEALRFFESNQVADLVLMDVVLSGSEQNGFETAKRIKEIRPSVKIIIITSMPEVSYVKRARDLGIESFWYKEMEELPILALMERTMAGESVYPDAMPELLLGNAKSTEFTDMEFEVLREMTTGATNREIAQKLNIAEATVNYHIQNLLQKTGYKNRVQLAVQARLEGLVIVE